MLDESGKVKQITIGKKKRFIYKTRSENIDGMEERKGEVSEIVSKRVEKRNED